MRIAETVTFGAGLIDRDAARRADPQELDQIAQTAQHLPVWRGKPLMRQQEHGWSIAALPPTEMPVSFDLKRRVYLGLVDGAPLFAVDVSNWSPDEDARDPESFVDHSIQTHPELPSDTGFAELRATMAGLSALDGEIAATARSILEWHRIHGFCANCGAKTNRAMAGWQRDCPDCGRSHFPRTDPVVIMLITHGNSVLLGRGLGWPDEMYSLLAGFMEPGETIEAATRREVFEETGVTVGAVDYLASQPWPYPSSLMIGTCGQATSRDITLDPAELADALWLTREELLDVFAGQNKSILPARKGSIAHFLLTNWLADRLD